MTRFVSSVFALCLLAAPLSAHADDTTKRAKIDEVFTLLHLDALMQQMSSLAQQQAKANMQTMAPNTDAATKAKADEFMAKMFNLINQELSWKSLEPEMAKIYSDNFTEAQIDDILVFYRSPTGKAMVEKLPQLTQQSMQIAQQRMADLEPKMKALADEMSREMPTPPSSSQPAPAAKKKS